MDSSTINPGPYDVLCCKSSEAYDHVGNRRLRLLVESHSATYAKVANSKVLKSQVVNDIIISIRSAGGKFLQRSKGCQDAWTVIPKSRTREKVGHALRRAVGKSKDSKKKTDSLCSVLTMTQPQHNTFDQMISNQINQIHSYDSSAECNIDPFKPIECFPPATVSSTFTQFLNDNDSDYDDFSDPENVIDSSLFDPFENKEPLEPLLMGDTNRTSDDELASLLMDLIET
eukprot:CAMPEP_0178908718 /NCGR_PEP_ID=MMETSP0786-20121207/8080_1 /TAXON_ID=186022 /ORGANISM="Thalassionema frauenfeldii, Strain CCMP 1798" /LENGTH=228 /DNA_ID=CAMNT_0020580655 /DNA_START=86 /DNA_END=772 /DNA_ORIENTATION=-